MSDRSLKSGHAKTPRPPQYLTVSHLYQLLLTESSMRSRSAASCCRSLAAPANVCIEPDPVTGDVGVHCRDPRVIAAEVPMVVPLVIAAAPLVVLIAGRQVSRHSYCQPSQQAEMCQNLSVPAFLPSSLKALRAFTEKNAVAAASVINTR